MIEEAVHIQFQSGEAGRTYSSRSRANLREGWAKRLGLSWLLQYDKDRAMNIKACALRQKKRETVQIHPVGFKSQRTRQAHSSQFCEN